MKYSQSLNRGAVFLSFIYFCVFIFIYETLPWTLYTICRHNVKFFKKNGHI